MDTIATELIKIASRIRERANSPRTTIIPDGYGGYEEVDAGPNEWLLGVASEIESVAKVCSNAFAELIPLTTQLANALKKLAKPDAKNGGREDASVADEPSDRQKRGQAMLIRYEHFPDIVFCQDEDSRKDPFQHEVEIAREFGHTISLETYKRKLTECGYEWCEIMHRGRDNDTTLICDATPGYKFTHFYEGMKVGDIKD